MATLGWAPAASPAASTVVLVVAVAAFTVVGLMWLATTFGRRGVGLTHHLPTERPLLPTTSPSTLPSTLRSAGTGRRGDQRGIVPWGLRDDIDDLDDVDGSGADTEVW